MSGRIFAIVSIPPELLSPGSRGGGGGSTKVAERIREDLQAIRAAFSG